MIESAQSLLNHSPLKRLGERTNTVQGVFRTPLEIFTDIRPRRTLIRPLPPSKHFESEVVIGITVP